MDQINNNTIIAPKPTILPPFKNLTKSYKTNKFSNKSLKSYDSSATNKKYFNTFSDEDYNAYLTQIETDFNDIEAKSEIAEILLNDYSNSNSYKSNNIINSFDLDVKSDENKEYFYQIFF